METTDKDGLLSNTICSKCECGKMKFIGLEIEKKNFNRKFLKYKCDNIECCHIIRRPYLETQMSLADFYELDTH